MASAEIITHYPKSDKNCDGDYWSIEVFVLLDNDTLLHREYGDYYHDKGQEKVEGYLHGIVDILGKDLQCVVRIDKADLEDYGEDN